MNLFLYMYVFMFSNTLFWDFSAAGKHENRQRNPVAEAGEKWDGSGDKKVKNCGRAEGWQCKRVKGRDIRRKQKGGAEQRRIRNESTEYCVRKYLETAFLFVK